MTLKDLQPQIAQGLTGFLEELQRDEIQSALVQIPAEDVHIARSFTMFSLKSIANPHTMDARIALIRKPPLVARKNNAACAKLKASLHCS